MALSEFRKLRDVILRQESIATLFQSDVILQAQPPHRRLSNTQSLRSLLDGNRFFREHDHASDNKTLAFEFQSRLKSISLVWLKTRFGSLRSSDESVWNAVLIRIERNCHPRCDAARQIEFWFVAVEKFFKPFHRS